MSSILFLAPDDLGEAVLATGVLAHVLRGEGDVAAICVSADAQALFRAAPCSRLWLPARAAPAYIGATLLQLNRHDVVIDGQGGFLGRLAPSRRRIRLRPGAILRHRCEDWAVACGAEQPLAPKLWLDEPARAAAAELATASGAPLLVLAPGGLSLAKRWPGDRFAAVARRLIGGPLAGAAVVVLGAATRDDALCAAIVSSLDADGVPARRLGEGLDLLVAAALMERATLVIGNDNALTHLAAAASAPTLTLFGPTDERVRAPWGPRTRTLRGRDYESLMALPITDVRSMLDDISVDAVEAGALDLLHAGGLR